MDDGPDQVWEIRYLRRKKVVASEIYKGTMKEAFAVAEANGPNHRHVDTYSVNPVKQGNDAHRT